MITKLLFDFLPIVLFFLSYKAYGLMNATIISIVASAFQVLWGKLKFGKYSRMHLVSFLSLLMLGGATLLLRDERYLKWKPTVVYWTLSIVFMLSHWLGKKNLIQHLAEQNINITLSKPLWAKLNASWAIFFLILGACNIYVLYNFPTDVWVNIKVFGSIGLTFVFVLIQALLLAKYIDVTNQENNHE